MTNSNLNKQQSKGNSDVVIARQPIIDRQCNVVAYELLFRTPGKDVAVIGNPDSATVNVIMNAFSNIGIESLLGGKKAYINFDSNLLKSDVARILPKDKIVIEILETVEVDDCLLKALRQLHSEGFHFALDDYENNNMTEVLYPFAETIKMDITQVSKEVLVEQVKIAERYNKILLAEKVETQNDFELCKSLGFKLFQGYFFARPTIVSQKKIPDNKQSLITVMNAVMDDADLSVIEAQIMRDVSISFNLLRFVNSAGLSRGQELETINEALVMLGRKQLYRWLSILLFSSGENGSKQPNALFNAAVYRGRLMELFGEITNKANPSEMFVVGAFSYLEALLERKVNFILKDMLLPKSIKDALLERTGEYGSYLSLAEAMTEGVFDEEEMKRLGLNVLQVNAAQLEATSYAESVG